MAFVNLHTHTDYSNFRLRDSTNKIKSVIEYAHSLGHSGVAITEHETIASSLEAQKVLFSHDKDPEWKDFKVILGNEIYLCPNNVTEENKVGAKFPHFILLALDEKGHEAIRILSTKAWTDNSFMHIMMRTPTYYDDLFEVIEEFKGHVVGSTACLGGSLQSRLLRYRDLEGTNQYSDIWSSCIDWIQTMKDAFGDGYFFLELQPSNNEEQIYVNNKLLLLAEQTDTPYIITTDAHYLNRSQSKAHEIFLAAQEGDREVKAFYETTYMMSEEEIHDYMDKYIGYDAVEQGFANTVRIYEMAETYDLRKPLHIPYVPRNISEPDKELFEKYSKDIPLLSKFFYSEIPSDRHMVREMLKAIDKDEYLRTKEVFEGTQACLDMIEKSSIKNDTHWSAYLLQISNYVNLLWEHDMTVGAGRGSGVGFIVLYMLGIIQINCNREEVRTFPWRFLNPDRKSILDIDLDISGANRDRAVDILKEEYGADRISKVLTVSTEKSRSALQTVCRGIGVDSDVAQYMSSLIVADRGQLRTLHQMYYGVDGEKPDMEFVNLMNEYPEVWENAQIIEGLCKGVGSHAGGIVLVDEPFTKTTALMKTNSGDIITQFDLHTLEDVSLIKVDLLSIEAIDKIDTEIKLLIEHGEIKPEPTWKETYEKYIGVYSIERQAEDMWRMLWNHKVLSFFQMEKESGIQAISLVKPHSVGDLATLNSVLRLMAQEKGAETPLHKYARFHNDITEWYKEMDEYSLTLEEQDILKEILGESCGICEAQEYLVLLTNHPAIGGFDVGWGDSLRRAVAKLFGVQCRNALNY